MWFVEKNSPAALVDDHLHLGRSQHSAPHCKLVGSQQSAHWLLAWWSLLPSIDHCAVLLLCGFWETVGKKLQFAGLSGLSPSPSSIEPKFAQMGAMEANSGSLPALEWKFVMHFWSVPSSGWRSTTKITQDLSKDSHSTADCKTVRQKKPSPVAHCLERAALEMLAPPSGRAMGEHGFTHDVRGNTGHSATVRFRTWRKQPFHLEMSSPFAFRTLETTNQKVVPPGLLDLPHPTDSSENDMKPRVARRL